MLTGPAVIVGVATAAVVDEGKRRLLVLVAPLAVVALPKMKPPPVAPVPVAPEPIVPVHDAPLGQQATWFAASGVQILFALQQTLGWPRFEQPR